ncbi:MAG: hypothetical protein WD425_21250 [Nitrospirales bacterium]
MNLRISIIVMTAVAGFAMSGTAWSTGVQDPAQAGNLEALTEESNLVVHGSVVEVEYQTVTENGETVPQTRVTYQVQETLRGTAEGQTVTLQFPGGPDGMGGFLAVSGVPLFQKGEEDIIFIRNNGEETFCPLVNCAYGRYRVDKNRVYNTHGKPVRGIKGKNALARGRSAANFNTFSYPAPKFDDLIKNPQVQAMLAKQKMSVQQARAEYAKSAPKMITLYADGPSASQGKDTANRDPLEEKAKQGTKGKARGPQLRKEIGPDAMSKTAFFNKVRALEKQAKRRPKGVKNVRKSGPIKLMKPGFQLKTRAPQPPRAPSLREQASAADEAEVKALRAQNFNPVLKRRQPNLDPRLKPGLQKLKPGLKPGQLNRNPVRSRGIESSSPLVIPDPEPPALPNFELQGEATEKK